MQMRVTIPQVPERIRGRKAFEANRHSLYAYNTRLGEYVVLSYDKHLATVGQDGSVQWSKGRYKPHETLVREALENQNPFET